VTNIIGQLLQGWTGQTVPLSNLNTAIATCLTNDTAGDLTAFWQAAEIDFAMLPQPHIQLSDLPPKVLNDLKSQLGWTIESLRTWTHRSDPRGARLEGTLIAVAHWNRYGNFWVDTRTYVTQNIDLCAALVLVLSIHSAQFQIIPGAPIWEREHLQALVDAENVQDWVRFIDLLTAFKTRPALDHGASQALLGLSFLDLPRLVGVASRVTTWAHAHILLKAIPLDVALRLATASANAYVHCAAVEIVANLNTRLSPSSDHALTHFLLVLTHDVQRWPEWARILARFPVRHPNIQRALGMALSRSSNHALVAYVQAIELTTPQAQGRNQVATCLTIFQQLASEPRRRALWHAAFKRWTEWNFGNDDSPTSKSQCELDFGVAAWLIEFADPAFIQSEMSSFPSNLAALERQWHVSAVTMIAKYNRLLSRYRMFAFADRRRSHTGCWLLGTEEFLPTLAQTAFLKARFRLT